MRAALLREKAARAAPAEEAARVAVAALVERMTVRLQTALGFPEKEAVVWRGVLARLVRSASPGFWTREGRLLYVPLQLE